ncbi:MAG: phytoene desaturase family protein, partial [Steroidobacteraceae bacterium]
MADADAIVVGSGHNGLVAAYRLARAGWRVAVLERSAKVGGAIRTESVTLPGFRHDLFATNLSLFKSSLVYREHQAELEQAGLRFITCQEAFASAYPDGKSVRISTNEEQTDAEFARCSAADRDGWRRVVSIYRRLAPHILPFTNMTLPSRAAAGQALGMLIRLRGGVIDLRDVVFASPRRFVDRFFQSDEAKGALLPWAFHLDFAPDTPGGAAFAFVSAASAHVNGLVLAQGGADAIVSALRKLIEAHGGAIHTQTDVSQILVERGRAIGVRTSSGDVVTATRAVIANVTPPLLFGRLLPAAAVPAGVRDRAARFRYGPGVFMVHLALSRHLDWSGGDDLW